MGYCFWQVSRLIWLFWMFPLTISAASIEKEATRNYVIVCVRTWVLLCHAHRSKDPYNQVLKCVHVCLHMSLWIHVCVCLMLSQGCCVKFTQTNNLKSEKQLPWTKCVATGNVAMRSACMCVYVCICVCVGLRQRACGVDCFMPGRTWKVERERESMPTHIRRLQTGKAFCHSYGCMKKYRQLNAPISFQSKPKGCNCTNTHDYE